MNVISKEDEFYIEYQTNANRSDFGNWGLVFPQFLQNFIKRRKYRATRWAFNAYFTMIWLSPSIEQYVDRFWIFLRRHCLILGCHIIVLTPLPWNRVQCVGYVMSLLDATIMLKIKHESNNFKWSFNYYVL